MNVRARSNIGIAKTHSAKFLQYKASLVEEIFLTQNLEHKYMVHVNV